MSATAMTRRRVTYSNPVNMLCLAAGSSSVGWLIGLSLSPVIQTVVGSILTFILGALGVLAGIGRLDERAGERLEHSEGGDASASPVDQTQGRTAEILTRGIDLRPVAVLFVGLAMGASAGIYARTNEFLGTNTERFTQKWKGVGLTDDQIRRRLFDQLYPVASTASQPIAVSTGEKRADHSEGSQRATVAAERAAALTASLYSTPAETCQLVADRHGAELRTRLAALGDDTIRAALAKCKSDECGEAIKVILCR